MHRKIAAVSFHLIISASPDLHLKNIFDENNFDYTFDYYDKNMNPQPVVPLSKTKPLICNLLGVQNMFNSLVLTFNQLFDYLASILGDHKLSDGLKKQLQEAQSILFLGFKFNKWYYKLIFRLLGFYENAMYQAPIDEIENLSSLKTLYLAKIEIDTLPEEFWTPENLEELDISWNNIENISAQISQLHELRNLLSLIHI